MNQVYFMHSKFLAAHEEVTEFIDWQLKMQGKETWIGSVGLRIYERKGNQYTWWYAENGNPWVQEDETFTSNIDIVYMPSDPVKMTEVRIVFSNHPLLFHYFERLAFALWDHFPIADSELHLPKLEEYPTFKSAAEYARESDKESQLIPNDFQKDKKSKRGRSRYSIEQRLDAIKEWDNVDPQKDNRLLPEFLQEKFGEKNGILNVSEQTFYSWRRRLRGKVK